MKWVAFSAEGESRTPLLAIIPTLIISTTQQADVRSARVTMNLGKASDQCLSVFLLELAELAPIRNARNDFSRVIALAWIGGDDGIQVFSGVQRWLDW